MKKLILLSVAFATLSFAAIADTYVNGYQRKDGTFVQGHYRSDSNNTVTDNYSYQGNSNPHTGNVGTNRYEHDTTSQFYSGPDNNGKSGHSGLDSNPYDYGR